MDIVIERGGHQDATSRQTMYRSKTIVLDVTHADLQLVGL